MARRWLVIGGIDPPNIHQQRLRLRCALIRIVMDTRPLATYYSERVDSETSISSKTLARELPNGRIKWTAGPRASFWRRPIIKAASAIARWHILIVSKVARIGRRYEPRANKRAQRRANRAAQIALQKHARAALDKSSTWLLFVRARCPPTLGAR